MSNIWVRLTDVVSKSLDPAEREAVYGDFAELALTDRQVVKSLLGLVVRRQLRRWRDWRPWFALVAIIMPVCPLLAKLCSEVELGIWIPAWMKLHHGISYQTGLSPAANLAASCLGVTALVTWSWTGGFALGTLSQKTTWASGALLFFFYVPFAIGASPFSIGLLWFTWWTWLPLITHILFVFLPAYCGLRQSTKSGDMKFPRVVPLALWTITTGGLTLWLQSLGQSAMNNWSRGEPALTLSQLAQHADLWQAGRAQLLKIALSTVLILFVLAKHALSDEQRTTARARPNG